MPSLVIVALPSGDDYINKISSEKVPHLTLLFLGDAEQVSAQDLDEIKSFVEFAAEQMLKRFSLMVDRRGALGSDQADVLFFKKTGYCIDDLNSFRSALLQQDDIRDLVNANDQFDEWMPHLTLGYPESPANSDDRDYPGLYMVNFDRIAVWNQDYAGTEYLLDTDDDYLRMGVGESFVNDLLHNSLTPSDIIDDILAHHGVLGMRWGHRSGRYASASKGVHSRAPATKRDLRRAQSSKHGDAREQLRIGSTHQDYVDARKDAKWLRATHGANLSRGRLHGKTTQNIIDEASKKMKPEIKTLNKKPEYNTKEAKKALKKYKGWLDAPDPIAKKYNKEVSDIYMKNIKLAAPNHMQVSPSGKWEDHLSTGGKGANGYWYVALKRTNEIKHAEMSNPDVAIIVRPVFDDNGYIVDFELLAGGDDSPDQSMAQSAIDDVLARHGDEILIHSGVPGMRWHHHKGRVTETSSRSGPRFTPQQKRRAKKVAIGVGVTAAVVGGAYVAYKLHQNGKIALPGINRSPAKIDELLKQHGTVRLNRKEYQRTAFRKRNKDVQLNLIKAFRMREEAQAKRLADRQRYIDLMRFSGKYKPSLEEATRIATETYPDVSLKDI